MTSVWGEDRTNRLRELYASDLPIAAIGERLGGVTKAWVLRKARELGLPRRRVDAPVWTDAEIERLREVWLTDMAASDIGKLLGRTKLAVVGKASRLGLPMKNRAHRERPAPRPERTCKPAPERVDRSVAQPFTHADVYQWVKVDRVTFAEAGRRTGLTERGVQSIIGRYEEKLGLAFESRREDDELTRLKRANLGHLLDLKRAGFRGGHGERRIPRENNPIRIARPTAAVSFTGSHAAMCADNAA